MNSPDSHASHMFRYHLIANAYSHTPTLPAESTRSVHVGHGHVTLLASVACFRRRLLRTS